MTRIDYDQGWTQWGDMIRYSPAPFHRRRLILKLADEVRFDSVLDVGCGNAELLLALSRRRPGIRLVGADISQRIVGENRPRFPGLQFHQLDIGTAWLPEQFDLVVCSEVIEHVADWRRAVLHLRKMCRRYLVLTTPSGRVYSIDRQMGHYRHFPADLLCAELRALGLEPERVWQWGFPFHTLYKYLVNLSPGWSLKRFSAGAYGTADRMFATAVTWLFYLNARRLGAQLVLRARAQEPRTLAEGWSEGSPSLAED